MLAFFLFGLLGLCVTVLIRSLYRLIAPASIGRDAYGHLLYARDIRASGHRIPEKPTKAATAGEYRYPFLMHFLISFVPENRMLTLERFFSPLMDGILYLLILATVPLGILDMWSALIAAGVFVFTPAFYRPNQSHARGMSARKLGVIFTVCAGYTIVLWAGGGWDGLIVVSMVLGAAICLTSKFGFQAFVFIMIVIGVLVTPVVLLVIPGAVILATVSSRGYYIWILRGHLSHLRDFAFNKQFKISYTKPAFRILPGISEWESFGDILETGYRSQLIRPLLNNIYGVPVLLVLVDPSLSQAVDPVVRAWLIGGFVAFAVTSLPYLKFLGEADRYLEYAFVPAGIALGQSVWMDTRIAILVIAGALVGAGLVPVYLWAFSTMFYDERRDRCLEEVIELLQDVEPETILVQPIWRGRQIAWETPHQVVDSIMNLGTTQQSIEEMQKLFPTEYGVVTNDIAWLREQYDIDYIVFDRTKSEDIGPDHLKPTVGDQYYENEKFAVVALDNTDQRGS